MTEITKADYDATEKLWDEVDLCNCDRCHVFTAEAFARHRMEERAAIVSWLRGPDPYPNGHEIADAIEAGEHLK